VSWISSTISRWLGFFERSLLQQQQLFHKSRFVVCKCWSLTNVTATALLKVGMKITSIPPAIIRLLEDNGVKCNQISPEFAACYLQTQPTENLIDSWNADDRHAILELLMHTNDPSYLLGLPLIPLNNGEVKTILLESSEIYYICKPQLCPLLPEFQNWVDSTSSCAPMLAQLCDSGLNLKIMDEQTLSQMLPDSWTMKEFVVDMLPPDSSNDSHSQAPPPKWRQYLFDILSFQAVQYFADIPLLPILGDKLVTIRMAWWVLDKYCNN
jgi:hypothetical protein